MLSHDQIWSAIDRLAQKHGMTASSLARSAGLDPTTFNRSKRRSVDGNARWPSTESIAKILAATQVSVDEFLSLIPPVGQPRVSNLPFRPLDTDLAAAFDAHNNLVVRRWEDIPAPTATEEGIFALGIVGNSYAPLYRDGDRLLLSVSTAQRSGDRVLILDADGTSTLAILVQTTHASLHIKALDGKALPNHDRASIKLVARILWASQ